jgi:hypothetical protein
MHIRLLLGLLIFTGFSPLIGQIGGTAAFTAFDLPLSARASALGGKALSVNDDDLNLGIWNPSLLSAKMNSQLALSFADYYTDIRYGYAGYSMHREKLGTFAFSTAYINYGNFRETDETGATIGKFTAAEYALTLGYSRQLDSLFTLGANLKFMQSNLYQWNANALGIDLAANYLRTAKNFSVSLLIRNVGVMLNTYTSRNRENLPFEIEAGFSKKPKHMPFRFFLTLQHLQRWDLTYTDPVNPPQLVDPLTGDSIKTSRFKTFGDKLMRHVVVGGEILIGKAVSLRMGYNYQRRKELLISSRPGLVGFSFGAGIRIYKINISYARAAYHIAGGTNTFSITANLGDFYTKKTVETTQ